MNREIGSGAEDKPQREFKDSILRIVRPEFGSGLTDMILALESYRRELPETSTPDGMFSEIKNIFHMLESVGSARIEGNGTTVSEYVESKIDKNPDERQSIIEIRNGEEALSFIDANIHSAPIDRAFVSELHKFVVKNLKAPPTGEGSLTPGEYRQKAVGIRNSEHVVVPHTLVAEKMDDLFAFINKKDEAKYDLLKAAIAHHRFVWIHPFDNGNGRTVRLFTYAVLLKYGFGDPDSRLINPAAVFCEDRAKYGAALAKADSGEDVGLLEWCDYMLSGLKREMEKIGRIANYEYLKTNILLPAIESALERQVVKPIEAEVLKIAIQKKTVVNGDITAVYPKKNIAAVSKLLKDLRDAGMIQPIPSNQRRYRIVFSNNFLLRDVMAQLKAKGFWRD